MKYTVTVALLGALALGTLPAAAAGDNAVANQRAYLESEWARARERNAACAREKAEKAAAQAAAATATAASKPAGS